METAMVSAWTSMPTCLILGFVGDEFISLLSWKVERRDPSNLQLVALEVAKAMANMRRLSSSPMLKPAVSGHKV